MSVTLKPLFEPVQIANAATTYFTATVATRIDKMTLTNSDTAASHYATIYWVPSGGTAGPANAILIGGTTVGKLLAPGETYDVTGFMGHTIGVGDLIAAVADAASKVNFFASGTQVS